MPLVILSRPSAAALQRQYDEQWNVILTSSLPSDIKRNFATLFNNSIKNVMYIYTSSAEGQRISATEFINFDGERKEMRKILSDIPHNRLLDAVVDFVLTLRMSLFDKEDVPRTPNIPPVLAFVYIKKPGSLDGFVFRSTTEITNQPLQQGQGRKQKTRRIRSSKKTRRNRRRTA